MKEIKAECSEQKISPGISASLSGVIERMAIIKGPNRNFSVTQRSLPPW
jgi:hypothetical protein